MHWCCTRYLYFLLPLNGAGSMFFLVTAPEEPPAAKPYQAYKKMTILIESFWFSEGTFGNLYMVIV